MPYRISLLLLSASALALAAPAPDAPPPTLVGIYQLDTDPALVPPPPGFDYTPTSFAFSPDEQWIAVTLGMRATEAKTAQSKSLQITNTALLLLPLRSSTGDQSIRIDLTPRAAVFWAPDSKSIAARSIFGRDPEPTKIYNLRGELTWTGPPAGPLLGFIAPDRLLARHQKSNGALSGFDTIDVHTSALTPWRGPRNAHFAALDSAHGLVAMFPDTEGSQTLIVDDSTGKIVQTIKNQNQTTGFNGSTCGFEQSGICETVPLTAPQAYFAQNGRTLCEAALVGAFKSHPECWDVATGKSIADFPAVDGGEPGAASAGASRLVVSKLNRLPGGHLGGKGTFSGEGAQTYTGHVVWDFRTGIEVAAWQPPKQVSYLGIGSIGALLVPIAISSQGHYVAEILGGELRLYQLP
ncbi:MAG TPA: hypothetical protein VGN17_23310 [Bryobacteraceae bacterium]|jgi:hypothetical protein